MCWSYLLEHDETRQLGDGERDGAENEAAEAEEDHVWNTPGNVVSEDLNEVHHQSDDCKDETEIL